MKKILVVIICLLFYSNNVFALNAYSVVDQKVPTTRVAFGIIDNTLSHGISMNLISNSNTVCLSAFSFSQMNECESKVAVHQTMADFYLNQSQNSYNKS